MGDGSTRVSVSFVDEGPAKATVAVAHERLPDPDEAETVKAWWKQRSSVSFRARIGSTAGGLSPGLAAEESRPGHNREMRVSGGRDWVATL